MPKTQNKKTRLKRKWLVIFTIIITLLSSNIIKAIAKTIENNENEYKKIANKCDQSKGYACSYYEIRQYLLNN